MLYLLKERVYPRYDEENTNGAMLQQTLEASNRQNMSKTQLVKDAKISPNAMTKMGKNGDISTEVLRKICAVLECGIED